MAEPNLEKSEPNPEKPAVPPVAAPAAPAAPPDAADAPAAPAAALGAAPAPAPEVPTVEALAAMGMLVVGAAFVIRVIYGFVQAISQPAMWEPVPGVADGWLHKLCHWATIGGLALTALGLAWPGKDGRAVPVFLSVLGGLTLVYTVNAVFWTINVIVAVIIILILAYLGLLQFIL